MPSATSLAARFKALADPTRVAIVNCSLGCGRGVRLQPHRDLRALAADDLPPSQDPARGRARRVVATRDVGLLPARAGGDRRTARCARRMNVLFVCKQNAGRSQMAQALYEGRGGNARSAGTTPASRVHPEVAAVDARARGSRAEATRHGRRRVGGPRRDDGLRRRLPGHPGQALHRLGSAGSRGQDVETVREIRDEIERRVAELPSWTC